MVVNNLYYNTDAPSVSFGTMIDDDVILRSLHNIYNKDFNPGKDVEYEAFRAVWKKLDTATDKGFGTPSVADPDFDFYNQIRQNNAVFSAFKVHRAQEDMAAQLLDKEGNLKPFKQWLNDVQPIASHQYGPWLQTEYDTAILRAHQAADWQQFERNADILPNLEWMPSTSAHPGEDHQVFWGTILPIDDPFWSQHRPGDRWNCKCGLEATDKPATDIPDGIRQNDNSQPGLDNNPGTDAKLFSDSHPYIANAGKGAEKAVNEFLNEQTIQRRNEIQAEASKNIQGKSCTADGIDGDIYISKDSIREFLNQPHSHYALKNELILEMPDVLKNATYVTKHTPFKISKRTADVLYEHFLEIQVGGDKSWLIVREYKDGNNVLYGISESEKVLIDPLKKHKGK